MKRLIAGTALGLAALVPGLSLADGYYGHYGYYGPRYYGGPVYYRHDGAGLVGDLVALPFVAAAAVLDTAATIATAPFTGTIGYAAPTPVYYAPRPAYYAPPRVYYAPPPPAYYAPRVVYRPYYAPGPVYYAPPGY